MKIWVMLLLGCAVVSAQESNVIQSPGGADVTAGYALATEDSGNRAIEVDEGEEQTADQAAAGQQPAAEVQKQLQIPVGGAEAVRLQIFLDQKHFGPGFIDGKPGMFTKLAIENYNISLGREKGDLRIVEESLKEVPDPYATAIIPAIVDDYVDSTLPKEREEQAERKSMPYRSVGEFMAERYHTSETLLIELNGWTVVKKAAARTALKVPNIEPFKIEDLKMGRSHKQDERLSARHVVVDTVVKQVFIYQLMMPDMEDDGQDLDGAEKPVKLRIAKPRLVASFPITPGQLKFIPKGFWNLKNSVELPEWRYDKQLLETGVRGDEYLKIPPGPNNPVGIIWNGLTKSGIGIHGTNNPRTIGRARSAGCIRLSNWDAARIPTLVRPGAVVRVK